MLNHRKGWYLKQDAEVRSNGLFLWKKDGGRACLINNLPYAYGFGGYSVTVVYMKGWKDLMYVLGFVDPHTEYDGVTQFYLVAVKYKKGNKKNYKKDKFEWQKIHSEEEFVKAFGKWNWKYLNKSLNLKHNNYRIA